MSAQNSTSPFVDGRCCLVAGATCGLLAVVLGALGAHALAELISASDGAENFARVKLYLFVHGLALAGVGLHQRLAGGRAATVAGAAFLVGSVLFQGSLLVLSLTGWRAIGYLTPFGGVSLMVGWLSWAIAAWRLPRIGVRGDDDG